MIGRKPLLLVIAGLFLTFQALSFAQTSAGLRGVVVDKDGQPLPAATVTLTNESLGVTQGAVTDAKGEFRIVPLPPGKGYKLKVAFPGMGTIVQDVEVTAGRISSVPVTLRPDKEMQEKIRVVGKTETVNTAETVTETKFSAEFIDALPILGRNYQDVLTLAPGVSDVDGDGNINVHGSRDVDVVTLVDGVSTVDPFSGQVGQQLNLDSIQEIEIKTSGASAEFGRAQGGFVNIITKSGGNDFEGNAEFLWRSNIFDGDGAGIDDPRLHGGLGELGLRDLSFNDYEPFVSISGPFKKDKAWYYLTAEYRQIQEPVNALTQAFVRTEKQKRIFGKATWEVSTNHKLQFTATVDPQEYFNLGIDSFTDLEAGFTGELGGLNLVLKETAILSPNVFLETTVQHFTSNPKIIPTLHPDTNGNGVLFKEVQDFGFIDANERDPGQDLDDDHIIVDGVVRAAWDVFEDTINRNGALDPGEDRDGDGRLTGRRGCEGETREDRDCDGRLDLINEDDNSDGRLNPGEDRDGDGFFDNIYEDRNQNGVLDPGEDSNGNGVLDGLNSFWTDELGNMYPYIEDRNNNRSPDDRPFLFADDGIVGPLPDLQTITNFYPYDRQSPLKRDRDYTFDGRTARYNGPYWQDVDRRVGRITVRQDLSLFIPEWHGQHDMKIGGIFEHETFDQDLFTRVQVFDNVGPPTTTSLQPRIAATVPSATNVFNEARNTTIGMYVNDTYKPLPNLTLNLGVRFDREATDSFGYTSFDPKQQREHFDRLWNLGGGELGKPELLIGNADGIETNGYCADPIFAGLPCGSNPQFNLVTAELSRLRQIAPSRLTQHHISTAVAADSLALLFPDEAFIIDEQGNRRINRDFLLAQGGAFFQEREAFRLTNNNLAPRLSVSWDPWADSKTKVFANWGRFYDKLFLGVVTPEEGPDPINRYYRKVTGVTANGIPTGGFGPPISKAPPSYSMVDRGLQTPFSDELSLGFERELAPETTLKLTFVDRKYRQGLQDTDINHALRFNPTTGLPLDVLGAYPDAPSGQASTRIADKRPDLYIYNFFFNQVFFVGNLNEGRYKGFELQLTKRLSRKWQMDASYTYSRALGAAESFDSDLGDDPATVSAEFSRLDFDQRHVVKLNLVTYLPRDWQVGGTIQWSSGLPYSVVSFFQALDNYDYLQTRFLFGFIPETPDNPERNFQIIRRNTGENNAYYLIDVRGEKAFVLGKFNSKVFLTVENLLNSDVLEIDTYEPAAPNRGANLQLDADRLFGRRFQVGMSLEF
jgi:outer membrane receptor protein involved in Fe transport